MKKPATAAAVVGLLGILVAVILAVLLFPGNLGSFGQWRYGKRKKPPSLLRNMLKK